jgi:glycerol-3-phosphate O-acyltransferase
MLRALGLGRLPSPAALVAPGYERFFRHIQIDAAWERAVRDAAARGPVVYVLRNVALLDLLALDYLTRRLDLPRVAFANELAGWIEPPASARRAGTSAARLCATIEAGASAVLFLKRSPTVAERASAHRRGHAEGDDLLVALLALQRRMDREIVMVPQTFVWTQRPEQRGFSIVDTLFGPSDFPGVVRAGAQFVLNYKNVVLRAGEPLGLREHTEAERARAGGPADAAPDPRRLTYALLRKVERERRAILGPARKANDRVREEVLRSPKLQAVIRELGGPDDGARALLEKKARSMLIELEARPDPETVKGLELAIDALVDRLYAGVDVDLAGLARVRDAASRGSVVLLPSHKSHVDYVLLSYVLRKNALQIPVVAAGDNLSFFPVGPVFRRAGAFFIRRKFRGDRLYTAVVDAYVRRLIREGWALEFFLEGGRSRTGKLLPPQVGLLNMVVEAGLALGTRPLVFVPVSIGYERMMEEGAYARELSGGEKRKEDASSLVDVGRVLREKYGRANVQFGEPLDLVAAVAASGAPAGELAPPQRRAVVSRIAHQVMSEINRVTAVTPGSLVAMALLCRGGRGLAHVDLVAQCARLHAFVRRRGARTVPSLGQPGQGMREAAIREAALLFARAGILRQHVPGDTLTADEKRRARLYTGDDVIYRVPDEKRILLDYPKNVILHFFVDRALVSVALLSAQIADRGAAPGLAARVRERVRSLSRLFKREFVFRTDAPFDRIFDETLADMVADGELAEARDAITFGSGHDGLEGRAWITLYAAVVRNFLEGYRVAARALGLLAKGPLAEKELSGRALAIGERMFLGGEIERAEAVSRPLLENAALAFVDLGYVSRAAGKLSLTESFATEEGARTIEAMVAGYLLRRAGETGA